MNATYSLLGSSSDRTDCGCCGKTNLKMTVALSNGGEVVSFGRDCAAIALLGSKSSSNVATIDKRARAISLASKWIAAGHSPEAVAAGIWTRFGYLTTATACGVRIGDFAFVPVAPISSACTICGTDPAETSGARCTCYATAPTA